jgi:hypothetical protein
VDWELADARRMRSPLRSLVVERVRRRVQKWEAEDAAGGGGALAWASERLTELMFTLEGSEVVLRDLHERPLHDLVRFQAQPGASGAVSGVSVALADGGQLYVGLSDGTVLRQKISGVIPRILRRKL